MKYTEQAVETLDDAGSVIANKNIEIEQLHEQVDLQVPKMAFTQLRAELATAQAEIKRMEERRCEIWAIRKIVWKACSSVLNAPARFSGRAEP